MAFLGSIPQLVKSGAYWSVEPFEPGQAAFRWDEFDRKNATIYIIRAGDYLKIGVTRNLEKRRRQIDAGLPFTAAVVATKTVPLAALLITEAWLHQKFADRALKNEWFALSDEEAVAALPEAGTFARAYARCCRDWFQRDVVRKINASL